MADTARVNGVGPERLKQAMCNSMHIMSKGDLLGMGVSGVTLVQVTLVTGVTFPKWNESLRSFH